MQCAKCNAKPATQTDPETKQRLCEGCHNIVVAIRNADAAKLYAYLNGSNRGQPLSVKQAAVALNISERKVYQLCEQRKIRHSTNPIRILPADLEAFLSPGSAGLSIGPSASAAPLASS